MPGREVCKARLREQQDNWVNVCLLDICHVGHDATVARLKGPTIILQ